MKTWKIMSKSNIHIRIVAVLVFLFILAQKCWQRCLFLFYFSNEITKIKNKKEKLSTWQEINKDGQVALVEVNIQDLKFAFLKSLASQLFNDMSYAYIFSQFENPKFVSFWNFVKFQKNGGSLFINLTKFQKDTNFGFSN